MTYLEALYGSQYYEIAQKGGKVNAGRLNGNLFLSAFIILCIFVIMILLINFSENFENGINHLFEELFGHSSGKSIGKLLAIPLLGVIYFVLTKTIGNEANYEKFTQAFLSYSDDEKQKASMKILKPFFIVLVLFFLLSMFSLF